jgi:hypothetical protein
MLGLCVPSGRDRHMTATTLLSESRLFYTPGTMNCDPVPSSSAERTNHFDIYEAYQHILKNEQVRLRGHLTCII